MNPQFDVLAPIATIMSKPVITVSGNDLMSKVRHLFEDHKIHHVLVIDDQGKMAGILSKHDLNKVLHGFTIFKTRMSEDYNDAILNTLLVEDVMRRNIVRLKENDTIAMAADIFKENLFHSLPVTDQDGNLKGIVTTYDLLIYAYA